MTDYADMNPGEFWAVITKARAAGADLDKATVDELIRSYPLTPDEQDEAARRSAVLLDEILAIRATSSA